METIKTSELEFDEKRFDACVMIQSGDANFIPHISKTIVFKFGRCNVELTTRQLEYILRNQKVIEDIKMWGVLPYQEIYDSEK